MSGVQPSVVCVVITFNPDEGLLRAQTRQLSPQVSAIVWVDNHSSVPVSAWAAELGVTLVSLSENRGVACAQNIGVAWAKKINADAVLLMDHDSIPASDMVSQLWRVMASIPTVVMGQKMALEFSYINTVYTGTELYSNQYNEIGVTLGTNKGANNARNYLRAGLTYLEGQNDVRGVRLNLGYWF